MCKIYNNIEGLYHFYLVYNLVIINSKNALNQAGITTTLNSRCSVLAAANSVFGRWDDTKGEENIDFMPTILSRFDMIFIVKDEHDEGRDVVSKPNLSLV